MAKRKAVDDVKAETVPEDDGLVEMVKDGQSIRAHQTQVSSWQRMGWSIKE